MERSELLRYFTAVLEQLGLRYFVTGSMATIFFGEPRFTNDRCKPHKLKALYY
jgi:hypothetical protein